jgi:SAM-dependent methyltransferase
VNIDEFVVCPHCRGRLVTAPGSFNCTACARSFPLLGEIPQFDRSDSSGLAAEAAADGVAGNRDHRRSYWDAGWQARFGGGDHAFLNALTTRQQWQSYLEEERAKLRSHGHVSVLEADRDKIEGRILLDIGCGAGASGAMFAYGGARYIGLDHSPHAAMYTLRHLQTSGGEGFTLQGNAEALPIRDHVIDVVYSNGVLHHTPHFERALAEAYRVLRPGGLAIITVYATYSTQFGLTRLRGALQGNLTRRAMNRWMGAASEGAWRTGGRLNPWTKTFSVAQLRHAVHGFGLQDLRIRKNGRPIGEIPYVGRRLMRFAATRRIDRALEPAFGSMLIMTFTKAAAAQ